jgi:uncharacterized membrane protein YsdA (DUF1294 family)
MSSVLYDLSDAARHLWRAPLFTLAVFAILAAGIGLNVAADLIDSTYESVSSVSVHRDAD